MDDYAMQRREYVKQIRASFDENQDSFSMEEDFDDTSESTSFSGFKLRFAIAVILFIVILFCKYNTYTIFGYEVTEIIDMIHDNQYYTFLQKYVKL